MKNKIIVFAIAATLSFSSFANFEKVKAALSEDNIKVAESIFSELTEIEKSSVTGQVLAGRLLLEKEESEDAFDHFEGLLDGNSENIDVNYYLGVSAIIMAQKASIFSKLGYAEDFLEAMEKTLVLKADHTDALNTLIGFHLGAPSIAGGDTDKALAYANQLKSFDAEQGYGQLANVYFQTDEADLAEKTFQKGIEEFPKSSLLYFTRASAYIKDEAWDKARPDLTFAIQFSKDDEEKSRALYQLGKVSAESGKEIDLGIESLILAIPIASEQYVPWVKYRLAQLYVHNKDVDKAKETLTTIENTEEDDDLESKVKKLKRKLKKLRS
jgi:tetratricopeptide (TPR) repeat protein